MKTKKCGSCLEDSFDPHFWPSLHTDLNEQENQEMKICDEHVHFYDILLGGFETKPIKIKKH